jgi:hypothetical protein
MKFNELYSETIGLWPDEIDISDGKPLEHGILFENLSSIWTKVENKAKKKGEWFDLATWIIFGNFHDIAKKGFQVGLKIVSKNQIDINRVKSDLINNLKADGYEDMLEEFEKNNTK